MSAIALLKQQLAETLAPARPREPGTDATLATGLAALDAALGGGLPRGRLTEIVGAAGSGTTSLVRHLVAGAVARGLAVAYVDATRTLAPRDWAFAGTDAAARDALWVVRPTDPARGAWCADVLLRSGAFALVVLDGAPPLARGVSVRLLHLARESDAALVVLGDATRGATMLGGAVRLQVAAARGNRGRTRKNADMPERPFRVPPRSSAVDAVERTRPELTGARREGAPRPGRLRQVAVTVEKGGTHQTVEVSCAVGVARRLCTHPEVPDRRGVGRARVGARPGRDGSGEPAGPGAARAADAGPGGGRKRRCAEPPAFVLPA